MIIYVRSVPDQVNKHPLNSHYSKMILIFIDRAAPYTHSCELSYTSVFTLCCTDYWGWSHSQRYECHCARVFFRGLEETIVSLMRQGCFAWYLGIPEHLAYGSSLPGLFGSGICIPLTANPAAARTCSYFLFRSHSDSGRGASTLHCVQ